MTPQLQLFMVLGALVLLCIIFTLLKRGLMTREQLDAVLRPETLTQPVPLNLAPRLS